MARASSLLTQPSGPAASGWSPTQRGEGGPSAVSTKVHRAELLAVTLGLERLRGSGRVVSDCKGVVRAVAALRAKVRPPRSKHIDLEKRVLRVGDGTPVEWIKAHTSDAQRQTLGLADEDVVKADVAAKKALPPPSPHTMQ